MTTAPTPEGIGGDTGRPYDSASPEPSWAGRVQWGPILAGAFAGLAAALLMGTLGAALGFTAGAVGMAQSDSSVPETAEKAAAVFGIGAVIWALLTAVVVGVTAGWVLNRCARSDHSYFAPIFGTVTWATGVFLASMLMTPGAGGLMAGLGSRALTGTQWSTPSGLRDREAMSGETRMRRAPTEEEKARTKEDAEKASQVAAGAAWILFCSQIISLASTILAAGWRRPARARARTETRIKPAFTS
jgi:hypothetical protein